MNFKEKLSELKDSLIENGKKVGKSASRLGMKAVDWMIENPGITTAVVVPTGIAVIRSSQSLIVSHRVNKQQKLAAKTWYDPSTRFRWDLKRPMTNNDRMAISKMKEQGMTSVEALMNRNLI